MKKLSTILLVAFLIALCVGECVAQSTSSASQTITFGVRRIVAPALAANFSQARQESESSTLNLSQQKVTVGSDIRSEELFVGARLSFAKKTRQQETINSGVGATESQSWLRSASPKSVITVTE
jgi:hypothetical protein